MKCTVTAHQETCSALHSGQVDSSHHPCCTGPLQCLGSLAGHRQPRTCVVSQISHRFTLNCGDQLCRQSSGLRERSSRDPRRGKSLPSTLRRKASEGCGHGSRAVLSDAMRHRQSFGQGRWTMLVWVYCTGGCLTRKPKISGIGCATHSCQGYIAGALRSGDVAADDAGQSCSAGRICKRKRTKTEHEHQVCRKQSPQRAE